MTNLHFGWTMCGPTKCRFAGPGQKIVTPRAWGERSSNFVWSLYSGCFPPNSSDFGIYRFWRLMNRPRSWISTTFKQIWNNVQIYNFRNSTPEASRSVQTVWERSFRHCWAPTSLNLGSEWYFYKLCNFYIFTTQILTFSKRWDHNKLLDGTKTVQVRLGTLQELDSVEISASNSEQ